MNTEAKLFKKGKYYVGDLCYVFDKSWEQVSDMLWDKKEDAFNDTPTKIFDKLVLCGNTRHGDGEFKDNTGRKYPVDGAAIGLMPVSLLKIDKKETVASVIAKELGQIIDFKEDFTASCYGGIFHFGDVVIDTANYGEENEYSEEW